MTLSSFNSVSNVGDARPASRVASAQCQFFSIFRPAAGVFLRVKRDDAPGDEVVAGENVLRSAAEGTRRVR